MPIGQRVVKQRPDITCMEYNGMEGKKRQGPVHWEVSCFSGGIGSDPLEAMLKSLHRHS